MVTIAHINRIGTARGRHEVARIFIEWAETRLTERRDLAIFRRMAGRSGIDQRWSVIPPAPNGGSPTCEGGFYGDAAFPPTSARMAAYAEAAPELSLAAIEKLGPLGPITHLVVASCTGFTAPGIDQIIQRRLGLPSSTQRTLIGFMGCYAAVSALRTADHIVRSEPDARVLVINVELPTLHLQPDDTVELILAQMLWSDGASAAIVSAEPEGIALGRFFAATLAESADSMRWAIGDTGFVMHLGGDVPGRIGEAIAHDDDLKQAIGPIEGVDGWAIHAGGRSILDAVQNGLGIAPEALRHSRRVLAENGNMSSATIMFVLAATMADRVPDEGVAIAFGPGLAAEGFRFRRP